MSKKKLKAKIKKLEAQVVDARASAVAQQIARMLLFHIVKDEAGSLPKEREGEPPVIGALRRAAEAASKAKAKP